MVSIKAMVAGLVCVSFCMADISGIVTDTSGVTPISSASVRIEEGNANTSSGADGRFTIVTTTAGVRYGTDRLLPGGSSAKISGNVIAVTLAQKSVVEVTVFDLSGKALSTVSRTLDAGSHSMALPCRGAGISLYKVKSGNTEFVLKGNTAGGSIATGSAVSFGPAKQAKVTATINDIINVSQSGYLQYRCVLYTDDTSGMVIKLIKSSGTVTDIDGNEYKTITLGNQVWMAENFRALKYNDGTPIPLDSVKSTWNADSTPKYCIFRNSSSVSKYSGALYNWHVVSPGNPKKLAPAGWHVPTDADWTVLETYLISAGYNWDGTTTGNKIAKSLAVQTKWRVDGNAGAVAFDQATNNRTGFTGYAAGYRHLDGSYKDQDQNGTWWSATEVNSKNAYTRKLVGILDQFVRSDTGSVKNFGFSVRLVKD